MSAGANAPIHCPAGFVAAGIACGIKADKPDLALFVTERDEPASAAGMFTRSLLKAAPVLVSMERLKTSAGRARAILINSGCANAATGEEGLRRCRESTAPIARALDCPEDQVLVCSTGVIGPQLPSEKIVAAAPGLARAARTDGLEGAARAIMTTDTSPKVARAGATLDRRECTVVGVAKGAGMIHPDMATLLVVLLTDARIAAERLDAMLREAVERSFHRITVDGDTSTNDTALVLASGAAGEFPAPFVQGLMTRVAKELALKVVRDGEGARKLLHVRAHEARDAGQALRVAQTLAGSLLVRTALAGGDPNWGRIIAAIARADPDVDLARLRVLAGDGRSAGKSIWTGGAQTPDARAVLTPVFGGDEAVIDIHLGLGSASDEFFSCDLTEEYVRINASYST